MTAQVHVLSGARAGLVFTLTGETTVIGRHTDAHVRFSPESDLEVSARHATITRADNGWIIRDLDSRNGTYVNGRRISADTLLRNNDRIAFGLNGPAVQFKLLPKQARRLRGVPVALALLLAMVVGTFAVVDQRRNAAWERDRAEMQQRTDSVMAATAQTVRSLEGQVQTLAEALRQSQNEIRVARAALRQAESRGETSRIPVLRRQLERATVTLNQQKRAAGLDFQAIQRANRPAIALVYVELETGEVVTGTAFAVRPNATLLTNRHVVAGAQGNQRARRIAVQFSDSEQIWPARIITLSQEADLAVIKVDNIIGQVPTVRSFNLRPDTITQGSAVAWIGFPSGGETGAPDDQSTARPAKPVLSAGVVSGMSSGRLEIQGYGAEGASGSPFFDANGQVMGVLLGGRAHRAGHTVYGVPASAAIKLLNSVR